MSTNVTTNTGDTKLDSTVPSVTKTFHEQVSHLYERVNYEENGTDCPTPLYIFRERFCELSLTPLFNNEKLG